MYFTKIGQDLIQVDETTLELAKVPNMNKIHLIKLNFKEPTKEKVDVILSMYPNTNRFVISGANVKFYNTVLKNTNKKYYVQNVLNKPGLISFFRKNNKVLLSIPSLTETERLFALTCAFSDILKNLEIIMLEEQDYLDNARHFKFWNGNVILYTNNYSAYL